MTRMGRGAIGGITENEVAAEYLPLTGGTLTGSLVGTYGSFAYGSIVSLYLNGSLVNLSKDQSCGFKVRVQFGEEMSSFSPVYGSSNGQYYLTDADYHYNMPVVGVTCGTYTISSEGDILLYGYIRNDAFGFTSGSLVYANTADGPLTHTRPSGSGDQVQAVGFAVCSNILFFNPQYHVIEVV